jgi:hypothetical protein
VISGEPWWWWQSRASQSLQTTVQHGKILKDPESSLKTIEYAKSVGFIAVSVVQPRK